MLERIWIHIQTYTIVALVNSPGLLMLWAGLHPVENIDFGPQSNAVQEAPIEIYSIQIEPEEPPTEKEDSIQKEKETNANKAEVKKTPSKRPEKKATVDVKKTSPSKNPPKLAVKVSKNLPFTKPSKKDIKQNRKKISRKRKSQCSPRVNRRIQQLSTHQFALQKKVVHRYLGNLDNIKRLAKAYWYTGKRGEGILLSSIPCKSPLRNMGIRPNDIIMSINGKKVKNNVALVGHYFELRSKKNVDITLKRQNRSLTLQYEIVKKLKKG